MVYVPNEHTSVETIEQFIDYVRRELRAISRSMSESTELELRTRDVEPQKPRQGMIVYADGSNWDPGFGEGAYVYSDAAGWVPLSGDYEFGVWTPVLKAATPGDLSAVYAVQGGSFFRFRDWVIVRWSLELSTWTHTTASGLLTIDGMPFDAAADFTGSNTWDGIVKAGGFTQFVPQTIPSTNEIEVVCVRNSGTTALLQVTDIPTATTPRTVGTVGWIRE